MPSLAPITVTTAWVAVQSGPFTGRISNLSGAQLYIRVSTELPTSLDGAVPLTVGMTVQLAPGETLYARAYDRAGLIQVDPELVQVMSPPLELLTNFGGPATRMRVDSGETGFWQGLQFRLRTVELVIAVGVPLVMRFTCPVGFILRRQFLEVDEGGLSLKIYRSTDGTPGGTFSTLVPSVAVNSLPGTPPYTQQATVFSGGTFTPSAPPSEVLRVRSANATAQQQSILGGVPDDRGLPAGSYYLVFATLDGINGTSRGTFDLKWEERP